MKRDSSWNFILSFRGREWLIGKTPNGAKGTGKVQGIETGNTGAKPLQPDHLPITGYHRQKTF